MPTKTTAPERVRTSPPATRNGRVEQVRATPPAAAPLRTDGRAAALRAGRRALARVPGYRELVASHGGRPGRLRDLSELPYLDKPTVFGGDLDPWIDGGGLGGAAELMTSSGQSGQFSVGVTSRAEVRGQERMVDDVLRRLGAGESSPTLLLNCLPMGIGVTTRLATVASPSVHLEMAIQLLQRVGPRFDRLVIVAEPLFLKELVEEALAAHGPGLLPPATFAFVGGEWVAESWRTYVSGVAGFPDPSTSPGPGVLVSMGAAELGLHCFFETPALRTARRALADPDARRALFGRDPGYGPSLLTYDPTRLYVEERERPDGWRTLAVTTLAPRLMPLVRYDLGDLGEMVPAAAINAELAARNVQARVDDPVVAVWGRSGAATGPGWTLRPEPVKERLFAYPALAASVSGRFFIEARDGEPWLHLQLRAGANPVHGAAADLRAYLQRECGGLGEVVLHDHRGYPHHLAGDFQHKPRYHALAR